MHEVEAFQWKTVLELIDSIEKIITRQEEQEILVIYGSDTYTLAESWKSKFGRDSAVWHSWSTERREKHVEAMRKFIPTLSETLPKPKHCGRKPGQQSRDRKRLAPDVIVERVSAAASPKHASFRRFTRVNFIKLF